MASRVKVGVEDRLAKQVPLRYSTQTSEIPNERGKLLVVVRLTYSPVLRATAEDGELDWALFGGGAREDSPGSSWRSCSGYNLNNM